MSQPIYFSGPGCAEQANPGTVFPWGVTPIVADKPSANGFYPMHLEVTR
jgi:hypothetical protein